ncbi:methyltransferase domain-containing protein [Paenibacillus filicis]|uniref:Methyltransferase domain-containing protein n=1 Tax=Paenibacillus gyeongsangnamensis TaxID=3388067 RepID=A0ABT4Q7B8_9BACL|nr:class I SAM-dependent methyltransferase [Paenibacillus filicis]MCZ8512605.1 methyltransferase domain-containing protein [Paenibacillus filicis]
MGFLSILSTAHKLIEERLQPGETAVDATAGNGVDTAFLARLAGPSGTVHAFDIQAEALEQTSGRLAKERLGDRDVRLHLRSHDEMLEAVPAEQHGSVAAVMFNLGYLPGQDHATVTRPDTTIAALDAAARLLRKGGIITIVLYTGHPGGQAEAEAVERWAAELPQRLYQSLQVRFVNQKNSPPYLIAVEKRQID